VSDWTGSVYQDRRYMSMLFSQICILKLCWKYARKSVAKKEPTSMHACSHCLLNGCHISSSQSNMNYKHIWTYSYTSLCAVYTSFCDTNRLVEVSEETWLVCSFAYWKVRWKRETKIKMCGLWGSTLWLSQPWSQQLLLPYHTSSSSLLSLS